jgi:hypothetical protein
MSEGGTNENGMTESGMSEGGMSEGQQGSSQGSQGESGAESGGEGADGQPGPSSDGSSDNSASNNGPASGMHNNAPQNGPSGSGPVTDNAALAEDADLENQKQSTALMLQRIRERLERGEVNQEQLDAMGVTEEGLRRFAEEKERDLANINNPDLDDPEAAQAARQFEALLRASDIEYDSEGDVRDAGELSEIDAEGFGAQRRPTPSEYRADEEAYRQRLLRQQQE